MKAVLCREFGPPESLAIEELPSPRPGPNEVVVSVAACGVNFPDALMIQGRYQARPPFPFAPGGEVAGIVKEVGAEVRGIAVGQRVIAFVTWGGFAEEVVAKPDQIIPIPDSMDFVTAAGFIITYGTSYHALKDRADLKPGESLLVLGAAGGVGLAAVDIGKAMGARVIAAASSADKLEVCRRYGVDAVIDYGQEDLKERVKQVGGAHGIDVIYDPVGGAYSEPALRGIAWKGRFLVVGFAAGDIPRLPLNLVLLKGCDVLGIYWGRSSQVEPERYHAANRELMDLYAAGKLRPLVSVTYPLERAVDALNDLLERRAKGKIVLVTERSGS